MTEESADAARKTLHGFAKVLAAVSLLLAAGAYLSQGIDFFLGVLLGIGVVGLNFVWTERVVRGALRHGRPRIHLAVTYIFKFGLTAVILFFAIVRFHVDPIGILVGLSTLAVTSFFVAARRIGR